ncbi:hypothetical protein KCU91_g5641, partial [Aureobasidium melanogenum]
MVTTEGQCAVCSKPGKLCASCENIHYCGRDCQKADWKVHKLLCRSFKDARDPPGPNMVRVIAFPEDDTNPKFLWMPIDDEEAYRSPLPGDYFHGCDPRLERASFTRDLKTDEPLLLCITIQTRAYFQVDGSLPNKSVNHLTNGKPRQKWAGPILFFGNVLETEDDDHNTIWECINLDTTHLNVIKTRLAIPDFKTPEDKAFWEEMKAKGDVFSFAEMAEALEKMAK